MIVNPVLEPHVVDDYDLLFTNGVLMPITVDRDAGDTVDFETSPLVINFHLAARTSPTDPDSKIPQEDITVFVSHLISITHRIREVLPPAPEHAEAIKSIIHKLHSTVQ